MPEGNFSQMTIKGITVYKSYSTIVAFRHPETGLVCCENAWSKTTGKHLNQIMPNKANRTPYAEFEALREKYID